MNKIPNNNFTYYNAPLSDFNESGSPSWPKFCRLWIITHFVGTDPTVCPKNNVSFNKLDLRNRTKVLPTARYAWTTCRFRAEKEIKLTLERLMTSRKYILQLLIWSLKWTPTNLSESLSSFTKKNFFFVPLWQWRFHCCLSVPNSGVGERCWFFFGG